MDRQELSTRLRTARRRWDRSSEEQQATLTFHEYCPISGVGISFEHLLMHLVLGDIYGDDPAQPHMQWALTGIAARSNEHYRGRLREAATGLVAFLREVDLIGGPTERR